MQAYFIEYTVRGKEHEHEIYIDAKSLKSAKKKIGRKHGYKTGNMIQIHHSEVIGYY